MAETQSRPENEASAESDHGLAEKIQDYHRKGGPRGDSDAKRIEGEITSAGIAANDDLEKAKPPSTPTGPVE
jgi:hypothetical protein